MKAWRLANTMNENFREPLLEKTAAVVQKGEPLSFEPDTRVLAIYQRMSARALKAAQADWKVLAPLLKS